MRAFKQTNNKLQRISDDGLQINILEFVAIITNIWLVIHYIKQGGPIPGRHIIDMIANNTSALSWLRYAAQSHSIPVRKLAYFCHGLILFSRTSDFLKIQGQHLAGKENVEADALSRPEIAPTIASAIAQFCQLKTCHACQLPYVLLSSISKLLSSPKIVALPGNEMMNVLAAELRIFPLGAELTFCRQGYF
jgi:hypothetical protein